MPIAPNPNNYTTGAMPSLFFQRTGGTEFHLGCISQASIEPTLEFLDHYCSQSGSRKKDKSVVTQKGLVVNFSWDEVSVENIRNFFYGDDTTNIGAGTDTAVDEEHIIPTEGLVKLEHDGVSSVVMAFKPDVVVHYDGSAALYTNFTTQVTGTGVTGIILADGGTIGVDTVDVLYIGHSTKFNRFVTVLNSVATLGSAVVKYEVWTGASWTDVTSSVSGAGKSFDAAGAVVLSTGAAGYTNWAKSTPTMGNLGTAADKYWMRISYTTADPTAGPDFNTIAETFVENTDYSVVPSEGYVFRLSAGGVLAGLKVDVSYTYTTVVSKRFNVLAETTIEGTARLVFTPDVGQSFTYFIPKCVLKTNGSFEFLDTGWVAPPSQLEVLDASSDGYSDTPFGYVDVLE